MQFTLDKCPGCQSELIKEPKKDYLTYFSCSSSKLFVNNNFTNLNYFKCCTIKLEPDYMGYLRLDRNIVIENEFINVYFERSLDSYGKIIVVQYLNKIKIKEPNLELMFIDNEKLTSKIKAYLLLQ